MKLLYTFLLFIIVHVCVSQNADVKVLSAIYNDSSSFGNTTTKIVSSSVAPISLANMATMLLVGIIKKDSFLIHNGLKAGGSLLLTEGITLVLKYSVNRERPYAQYSNLFHARMKTEKYSFPSGHTSLAFATATSLSLAYPKWYVIVPSYVYACGVAYSRMYLGVHYPTDVLAGALIGAACSYASVKIEKWLMKKYARNR